MKPKIFNTQEVQAILDGRKTQFRTVVKVRTDINKKEWVDTLIPDYAKHQIGDILFVKQKDARIFLKVTNVRVERLQDISDEDCIKSGIYKTLDKSGCFSSYVFTVIKPIVIDDFIYTDYYCSEVEAYEELWSSKAKEDYKWEDNPYVFVYEFERVDR